MKSKILYLLLLLFTVSNSFAKDYKITSPDGAIVLTVNASPGLTWSATYNGTEILTSVKAGMVLGDGKILGENESVRKATQGVVNQVLEPVVAHKRSRITDNYNYLTVAFKSGLSVQFRAYNDGVAYRFETAFKNEITIKDEISSLQFPSGSFAWYPLEESFMSHNERVFIYSSLDTISDRHLASLPTLFKSNGVNVLITEADIEDYPHVVGGRLRKLTGVYPNILKRKHGDRNLAVTNEGPYCKTKGTRTFSRAFVIAEKTDSWLKVIWYSGL
jgi:alpha-glucosidase